MRYRNPTREFPIVRSSDLKACPLCENEKTKITPELIDVVLPKLCNTLKHGVALVCNRCLDKVPQSDIIAQKVFMDWNEDGEIQCSACWKQVEELLAFPCGHINMCRTCEINWQKKGCMLCTNTRF